MPKRDGLLNHRDLCNAAVVTRTVSSQAITVEKQLAPIYVDTRRDDNGGTVALSTNESSGTRTIIATTTHTIPSWVGSLNLFASGNCQFNASTGRTYNYVRFSTAAFGSRVSNDSVSADRYTSSVTDRRVISSPGATVNVHLYGVSLSTYTVAVSEASINSIALGVR